MSQLNPEQPVLSLEDVHHAYGDTPAVRGLNLVVGAGEVVCLLGPSGCGKTTALRIAAGLEPIRSGSVALDGKVVSRPGHIVPPERRNLGLVFQDYALFPHMTIAGNVAFGLSKGVDTRSRVAAVLDQVGLGAYADSYPHELSGGQQQRVALARALAPEPRIILMDEPFSGLDARLRESVRDRTLHILKQSGSAVLMVTHDAEEAMHMADRIIVMRDGRVEQEGAPDTLYLRPANGFVAEFFGDVNKMKGTVRNGGIDTPLGRFETRDVDEGREAQIVIRPEALSLGAPHAEDRVQVKVLASRMLGRSSLIHLCTCQTTGKEQHLHSRMPGCYLPREGDLLSVTVDRSQVFVFPVEGAT